MSEYDRIAEFPSQEWHDLHQTGLSGSDAYALLGESKYTTPLTVWSRKVGVETPPELDEERLYWGQRLEGVLSEEYETRTGRPVERNAHLLRARAAGLAYLIGTPDGFIHADEHAGPGIWECKTTGSHMKDAWADGVPEWVRIQVHHYMLLTGCSWGSVCCLIGGQEFVWADVPLDTKLLTALSRRLYVFWHDNVKAETPPEPGDMEEDRRVLGLLQPEGAVEPLLLDGNGQVVAQRYANLGGSIKKLEVERRKCANALRAKMRAHSTTRAEGGGLSVTWTKRNGILVKGDT